MIKRLKPMYWVYLLCAGFVLVSQSANADLTFQAYDNGGGETRLTVVAASGSAIDSNNNAYFYGFGTVVAWDDQLTVMASSVTGTIAGSELLPNQFLMDAAGFDGAQTGWQIALASDAGSLVGSDAYIIFPLDPSNFSVQYTLNPAFGAGSLGTITILPVDPDAPPLTREYAPVPLRGAALLIALLGLTGLLYARRVF